MTSTPQDSSPRSNGTNGTHAHHPSQTRIKATSEPNLTVGILCLQGDYEKHEAAWREAGAATRRVDDAESLSAVDALSMPGGESTTMLRLLEITGLREPLRAFVAVKPVFATCAGLILLARELTDGGRVPFPPLGVLDVEVERNAYGRQIDSFQANVSGPATGSAPFEGVFIRAPRIKRVGAGIEVVVRLGEEPVGVRHERILGLCFHPELTPDRRLHRWFLEHCVRAAQTARSA
ncbi:MAG TPA: pyridoxal 5'-phosphate synthase glutaminase subunit PdxT [Candidatus Eisenbacteria bacterium]|nr:pyridoxal 5'-phosphate synthase glutaminase subunit PdxT [Candidatus Eisenbacteria bacterium]